MAIAQKNLLMKPRIVEEEVEIEDSSSEESDDLNENKSPEDDDNEWGSGLKDAAKESDIIDEIKKEVEDGEIGMGELVESYNADPVEVKEDPEESDVDSDGAGVAVSSKTKSVKFSDGVGDSDSEESDMESDGNDDDDDDEDDFGDVESDGEETKGGVNSGLANVMAKILGTRKSGDLILSKAKKNTDKVVDKANKDADGFEVVDRCGKVKTEPTIETEPEEKIVVKSEQANALEKKIWASQFRVKPNIVEDREKERRLRVLATQGVVQLFSAIEKHKNQVQKKLAETRSVMGREKILETTGKEAFLEVLKQEGKRVGGSTEEELFKEELKEELIDIPAKKKPRWNVFAENFYQEPTLQGWDQASENED